MDKNKKIITRRDFLRAGTAAAVGGIISLPLLGNPRVRAETKSRVVLIRDKDVFDSPGKINPDILVRMLDNAVTALVDAPDPIAGWKKLVKPDDIVGIKSNFWHFLRTPEPLELAIQKRLLAIGVKEGNMAVDDRGILRNPVFQKATALINTRPMRTHHWAGVGTLIKNYIMFTSRPSDYHDNACENLGKIWHFPQVEGKTRLNILVMLTPQFHGLGPHTFSEEYVWTYGGLIVSTDPVAADSTGCRIIQAKRDAFFGKQRPISPPPHHIAFADTKFGLGNSRPEKIEIVKLGWDEATLI